MTDLYVLNWAAMQAVSALEARLRSDDEAVLIAEPRVEKFGVVDRVQWLGKHWVDIRTHQSIFRRINHWADFTRKIGEIVKKTGPIRRCYVGQLGVPMSHIAHACGASEVVVLDAGLVTLKVARQRHQRLGLRQRFASGIRAAIGVRGDQPGRVTFFSAYDLEVREPDHLQRHAYERLRAAAAGGAAVAETWFVGQNFVEGGMMTPERYEAVIAAGIASAQQGSSAVVYVAHPRETDERLAGLAQRFGFVIRRLGHPLEIELLQNRPKCIVGVCSSALHSAAVIGGDDVSVRAVRIDGSDVLRFRDTLNGLYEQLEAVGVQVVEAR